MYGCGTYCMQVSGKRRGEERGRGSRRIQHDKDTMRMEIISSCLRSPSLGIVYSHLLTSTLSL
jgi:hypothetical protein